MFSLLATAEANTVLWTVPSRYSAVACTCDVIMPAKRKGIKIAPGRFKLTVPLCDTENHHRNANDSNNLMCLQVLQKCRGNRTHYQFLQMKQHTAQ